MKKLPMYINGANDTYVKSNEVAQHYKISHARILSLIDNIGLSKEFMDANYTFHEKHADITLDGLVLLGFTDRTNLKWITIFKDLCITATDLLNASDKIEKEYDKAYLIHERLCDYFDLELIGDIDKDGLYAIMDDTLYFRWFGLGDLVPAAVAYVMFNYKDDKLMIMEKNQIWISEAGSILAVSQAIKNKSKGFNPFAKS